MKSFFRVVSLLLLGLACGGCRHLSNARSATEEGRDITPYERAVIAGLTAIMKATDLRGDSVVHSFDVFRFRGFWVINWRREDGRTICAVVRDRGEAEVACHPVSPQVSQTNASINGHERALLSAVHAFVRMEDMGGWPASVPPACEMTHHRIDMERYSDHWLSILDAGPGSGLYVEVRDNGEVEAVPGLPL